MTDHACFHCGAPTEAVVSRVQPPALARYICTSAACYQAWLKLHPAKTAKAA